MHRPSVLASANPLRKGQRFVRPSRKDAGRDLCGRRDGVFQVSRTKPCAQFEPFIAETEDGYRLSAELDGCEFKGRFVGHDPFPLVRGLTVGLIGRVAPRAVILLPLSITTAAPASSTSKKARARSSGPACHADHSPPTPSASSSTLWPTISAISCGRWRCRRRRSRGR